VQGLDAAKRALAGEGGDAARASSQAVAEVPAERGSLDEIEIDLSD
jgi:hypothetical protein